MMMMMMMMFDDDDDDDDDDDNFLPFSKVLFFTLHSSGQDTFRRKKKI